jgi:hypothetical protein
MEQQLIQSIEKSVEALERRNRRLTLGMYGLFFVFIVTLMGIVILWTNSIINPNFISNEILRVRGLVIVDAKGTERVWIGAPVPEPLVLGKRLPRGGDVSGILLFDEEGNERSGYVTSDGYPNVLFTLDSLAQQHVLFMTEPQGDPTLRLWNSNNAFQLTVGEESPELKLISKGEVVFEASGAEVGEK